MLFKLKNYLLIRAKNIFSLGRTFIHVVPHFLLTEEGKREKKTNRE